MKLTIHIDAGTGHVRFTTASGIKVQTPAEVTYLDVSAGGSLLDVELDVPDLNSIAVEGAITDVRGVEA